MLGQFFPSISAITLCKNHGVSYSLSGHQGIHTDSFPKGSKSPSSFFFFPRKVTKIPKYFKLVLLRIYKEQSPNFCLRWEQC